MNHNVQQIHYDDMPCFHCLSRLFLDGNEIISLSKSGVVAPTFISLLISGLNTSPPWQAQSSNSTLYIIISVTICSLTEKTPFCTVIQKCYFIVKYIYVFSLSISKKNLVINTFNTSPCLLILFQR